MEDKKYGTKWSDEETILAFYYYCKTPIKQLKATNPEIIRLSSLLGRTASSVSLKMWNLLHFDPDAQKQNIAGMRNASKTDARIVAQFLNAWEDLTFKAIQIEMALTSNSITNQQDIQSYPIGNDVKNSNKARINQQFFREAVLTSYYRRCCITGISIPELLIASHIKPWAISDPETERTNPRNGLCLNALHDKAFDQGLITVLPDYTVRVSSKLKEYSHPNTMAWLLQCDKQPIAKPEKFFPCRKFLEYHNDAIFIP